MYKDTYPVLWAGGQAIVMLPEHINAANAGQIREELLALINRGPAVLLVDMTATASCDYAGVEALVRAYRRAVANGTQLRLVVPAKVVRHVLSGNGLARLVSVYPSREAATAAGLSVAQASTAGPSHALIGSGGRRPVMPGALGGEVRRDGLLHGARSATRNQTCGAD